MPSRTARLGVCTSLAAAVLLALSVWPDPLSSQEAKTEPKSKADSCSAAMTRLASAPNDPYLQYVALMLAHREGRRGVPLADDRFGPFSRIDRTAGRERDLFGIFTGALAIQESLQLDTMLPEENAFDDPANPQRRAFQPPRGFPAERFEGKDAGPKRPDPKAAVKLSRLYAPRAPSHPWEKLLGDQKPLVSELSKCVPEVFWFAEFPSLTRLKEIAGDGDVLGGHLFTTLLGDKRSSLTLERIQRQLGLISLPKQGLEILGIEGVGVTGSDLYLTEGSDVTVLIKSKRLPAAIEWFDALAKAEEQEKGEYLGVAYRHRRNQAAGMDVYCAEPRDDLHVRSTSLPAFKKVLEAITGKTADGKPARSLGESAEFRYVRSVMPSVEREEDGFVYLSDSFIHRVVGPELKIRESRRIRVYNHLRMIGHAALMFRTEFGRAPKSLEELAETKCAPGVFGKDRLAHPDGGTYSLSADGTTGVCSKYGTVDRLTPCLELPLEEATREEAEAYHRFVQSYDEYWRTFFDPIVVRVKATDKEYRLETLVLPLIDNSIYTSLARQAGGKPQFLDVLPTPKSEAAGIWMALNKQPLLALAGQEGHGRPRRGSAVASARWENNFKQIALAFHNYHDAYGFFPSPAAPRGNVAPPNKGNNPPVSWRVQILPYIEQENLYRMYKPDEPWDSENNKKLIPLMPAVFRGPNQALNDANKTTLLLPTGKGTLFPKPDSRVTLPGITDGTSNTILLYDAADENAVVWTKPDEPALDVSALPKGLGLGRGRRNSCLVTLCDGSVRSLPSDTSVEMLRRGFDPADGKPFDPDARPFPTAARTEEAKSMTELAMDIDMIIADGMIMSTIQGEPFRPTLPKNAKLSWRVALLPHIGETLLYEQFKLDEPWDSEHNKKLLSKMPRLYMGTSKALNAEGKTQIVLPTGKGTAFPTAQSTIAIGSDPNALRRRDLPDDEFLPRPANPPFTITHVIVPEAKAVPWTKPDDLEIDPKEPRKDLLRFTPNSWLVGSTAGLKHIGDKVSNEAFAQLFDPGKSASADIAAFDLLDVPSRPAPQNRDALFGLPFFFPFGGSDLDFDPAKLRKFLTEGVGDQVGFHIHDAAPLLEINAAATNPSLGGGALAASGLNLILQSLTGPTSVSLPVKDAKVVDEFLAHVDDLLRANPSGELMGLLKYSTDLYQVPLDRTTSARSLSFEVFVFKYRIFWARIGSGLYFTNRWGVLEQILAAQKEAKVPQRDRDPAHLTLKLRPENWKEFLFGFRLAVGESERRQAYDQLAMLNSVHRGWPGSLKPGSEPDAELLNKVVRVYDRKLFVPPGAKFVLDKDGREFVSTVHGTPADGRLADPRDPEGTVGQLLRSIGEVRASLTLEKDSLRAVVIVERK